MNGPDGFLPKNQNFMTQVARILWYRPVFIRLCVVPKYYCEQSKGEGERAAAVLEKYNSYL